MSIKVVQQANKTMSDGKTMCTLEWDSSYSSKMSEKFNKAQTYIDNEVLRFCSARVPFRTGNLQKSGIYATVIGSGEVRYNAIYAAHQYYYTQDTRSYDAIRGAHWFERGKASEKSRILIGARQFF